MTWGWKFALALVLALGVNLTAAAQPGETARVEISGGIRWIGPVAFGDVPAVETTFGGGTRNVFDTATTLGRSVGPGAAFGIRLSRSLRAEAALAFNRTQLSTRITGDVEAVPDVTVSAPVTQYLVEGGLLAQPARWRMGRVSPFVTGGLGYLRQLNDGRTLVETGRSYYAGAGLYYVRASTRPRRVKATGVRADVRALIVRGGVAPDSVARSAAAVTAALFARF